RVFRRAGRHAGHHGHEERSRAAAGQPGYGYDSGRRYPRRVRRTDLFQPSGRQHVAATRFSAQSYEAPLRGGFVRHGNLAPSMAVAGTHAPVRAAAVAASTESATLPRLQLSVAEYGLGVPSIVVYAAAEPKRLQVAGAALAVGPAPSPG